MLFETYGKRMLGFSKPMTCKKCNQLSPHLIREEYVEQKVFFIPVPTSHGKISICCPVCEKEDSLTGWLDNWSHTERKKSVVEILEDGKEYTKHWLLNQDHKTKEKMFKRLNALKAYSLVKYLSG